jgi:uncharacterized protein (DUF1697 family)
MPLFCAESMSVETTSSAWGVSGTVRNWNTVCAVAAMA